MGHVIPFTDEGMLEATSRRVTSANPEDAWRRVVAETRNLSDAERAEVLSATALIKPPAAYRPRFHIAGTLRVVAVQGGWWYRGVTSVEPHPDGSLVTYTIVNVAPGWSKWIAHVFQAREHRKRIAQPPAERRAGLECPRSWA